jgi:hypothetical protein
MMKATIEGEDDEYLKIYVTDNAGAEHDLTIEKASGEIVFHQCDSHGDKPQNRTPNENEQNEQARRYAQWYVYRERGYDTVPASDNPDRIFAVILALIDVASPEFDQLFEDLKRQLRSHFDGSTVQLPFENVDPDEFLVYQQDIYVQPDPTELRRKSGQTLMSKFERQLDDSASLGMGVAELITDETVGELMDFQIEAVSGLHYLYNDGYGNEQRHRGDTPLSREPDARLDILPQDPAQFESFRLFLIAHLGYQIRDCYLSMGLTPPETFQAQGVGKYQSLLRQKFTDIYEDYYDTDATIESWQPK